jgi:hypothetical protein
MLHAPCRLPRSHSPRSRRSRIASAPAKLQAGVLPDAASTLQPKLAAADSFEAAIEALRASRERNIGPRVVRAVEHIEQAQGQSELAELARELA